MVFFSYFMLVFQCFWAPGVPLGRPGISAGSPFETCTVSQSAIKQTALQSRGNSLCLRWAFNDWVCMHFLMFFRQIFIKFRNLLILLFVCREILPKWPLHGENENMKERTWLLSMIQSRWAHFGTVDCWSSSASLVWEHRYHYCSICLMLGILLTKYSRLGGKPSPWP